MSANVQTGRLWVNGDDWGESFELTVNTDQIDVTPAFEPDPSWEHVDSNGHYHAYSSGTDHYPTLLRKSTADGYTSSYEYEGCVHSWMECRICGQEVSPAVRRGQYACVPGMPSWSINTLVSSTIYEARTWDANKSVSVHVDLGTRSNFGIAVIADFRLQAITWNTKLICVEVHLAGTGDLGSRP